MQKNREEVPENLLKRNLQQRKTRAVFRRIITGAVSGTESERVISDGHKRLTENTFFGDLSPKNKYTFFIITETNHPLLLQIVSFRYICFVLVHKLL